MAVFNRGTAKGFMASIPIGGQAHPNSIEGDKEELKKAQKKLKKKHISEIINNSMPNFKPFCTFKECKPWKVASLVISLNHINIDINNKRIPKKNKEIKL